MRTRAVRLRLGVAFTTGFIAGVLGLTQLAVPAAHADTVVPPLAPQAPVPEQLNPTLSYLAPLFAASGGRACAAAPAAFAVAGLGTTLGFAAVGNYVPIPTVPVVQPTAELAQATADTYM